MDDSKIQQNINGIDGNHGMFKGHMDFGYVNRHGQESQNFLINLMKYSLLVGAEKMLMARKSPKLSPRSHSEPCKTRYLDSDSAERRKGKYAVQLAEKACAKSEGSLLQSGSSPLCNGNESGSKHVLVSKVIDCPSKCYGNEFPSDIIAFLSVLVLKLAGFHICLLIRFFTFPIWLVNFWLTMWMFPLQTLALASGHVKQKLLKMWSNTCLNLMSFICDKLKMQKSLLKLAVRFCWAFFWSIYVCLVLVGLLVMGFVIGGISMRHLVEEPIQTTETLNFDYTKSSPVAFVPITSSPVAGVSSGLISKDRIPSAKPVGERTIPYNHKLQLTVSLTMPESEYNRNLGIFQVRVECLSIDGKVTASSSYPSMLQFKSQPIQYVETIFKSIPLLTGFQSEVQNLKVGVIDFIEGYEPTACFKVIIEQRAEYEPGFGIPEVYAALLGIDSELPQFKRIIWSWRRTIFVWISFVSCLSQLVIAMLFCRPIVFPGGILMAVGTKGKSQRNKISWNKSV